jgi:hypothetical protein
MSRVGFRRRGRATQQRALGCPRGIAVCTWYRAAVARALGQVLYRHLGAIFFGGRGDTRARATENLFQPLLLLHLFASCLVDYLETEIQNSYLCARTRQSTFGALRACQPVKTCLHTGKCYREGLR